MKKRFKVEFVFSTSLLKSCSFQDKRNAENYYKKVVLFAKKNEKKGHIALYDGNIILKAERFDYDEKT